MSKKGRHRHRHSDYLNHEEGMFRRRYSRSGNASWEQLSNFEAHIKSEVVIEDGKELHRIFTIEASLDGIHATFDVNADQFFALKWPVEHLGARATIYPGYQTAQHIIAAIQSEYRESNVTRMYAHTGWVQENHQWVYLHATGAIRASDLPLYLEKPAVLGSEVQLPSDQAPESDGSNGPKGPLFSRECSSGCAMLPEPLQDFELPSAGRDFSEALDDSLFFLALGPPQIVYLIFAAIWRAVIGGAQFGIHLAGPTGQFKSEIAGLAQQFFGASMDARNLKGAWSSTANALEATAYILKDSLLVVDDFAPSKGAGELNRLTATADRLFRSAGNAQGRARANSVGQFRAGRHPRALLFSTGEDIPIGHSLRARMVIITLEPGCIDQAALTTCQKFAREGQFAYVTATFIAWLAGRRDEQLNLLRDCREDYRKQPHDVQHRRVTDTSYELYHAFEVFLDFAREVGGLAAERAEAFRQQCQGAILEAAWAHQAQLQFADPVESFCNLLVALLASKQVHIACMYESDLPYMMPEAWGYRCQIVQRPRTPQEPEQESAESEQDLFESVETWLPCGTRIGWTNGQDVFLIPEVCFAQLQILASKNNTPIQMTLQTLEKRLVERGIVVPDPKRKRIRQRITIERVRHAVLMIPSHKVQWIRELHGIHPEDEEDHFGLLA